jgi:hypothetical protein
MAAFKAPEEFKLDRPPKNLQTVESTFFMSIILSKKFFPEQIRAETKQA